MGVVTLQDGLDNLLGKPIVKDLCMPGSALGIMKMGFIFGAENVSEFLLIVSAVEERREPNTAAT